MNRLPRFRLIMTFYLRSGLGADGLENFSGGAAGCEEKVTKIGMA